MQKIVFVTSSLTLGGAERNVINLGLFLPKKKYSTEIISLSSKNEFKKEYGLRMKKLKIHYLSNSKRVNRFFETPKLAIQLLRLTKKRNYEILIAAHEYNTFYLTAIIALLSGKKSILIVGNNLKEDLKHLNPLLRAYHKVFLSLSFSVTNHIICVSKGLKHQLRRDFGVRNQKCTVVYNGVEGKTGKIDKKSSKTVKIVAVGRLIPRKGHAQLIKIINYLLNVRKQNANLTIIGSGPLQNYLTSYISRLNLKNNVTLIRAGNLKLSDHFKTADIFAFPSYYEGFGNVIIEAMVAGVPVVSTNCNFGPEEILDNSKYGILSSSLRPIGLKSKKLTMDEIEFADNLEKLIKDPTRRQRLSIVGKKRAQEFNIKRMSDGYDTVLVSLLRNNQ